MTQLAFSDASFHPLFHDISPHIVDRFVDYHKANPHVYDLFKKFARELLTKGLRHYGAKAIMERIRWHIEVETACDDFKINNNYTSCYTRLLINEDPIFKNFFDTRRTPITLGAH